jgi:hypothetical protein
MIADDFNFARYRTGQTAGHYESYFQRANHPTLPRAFWVRYTIFSPSLRPREAIGELLGHRIRRKRWSSCRRRLTLSEQRIELLSKY